MYKNSMSAKKKPSNQPSRRVAPVPISEETPEIKQEAVVEPEPEVVQQLITEPVQEQIYIPSENADKYPVKKTSSTLYKILAYRNDYVRLQDEVVKYLNDGWQLAGGLSTCMTVSPYESVTVFSQALIKY